MKINTKDVKTLTNLKKRKLKLEKKAEKMSNKGLSHLVRKYNGEIEVIESKMKFYSIRARFEAQ